MQTFIKGQVVDVRYRMSRKSLLAWVMLVVLAIAVVLQQWQIHTLNTRIAKQEYDLGQQGFWKQAEIDLMNSEISKINTRLFYIEDEANAPRRMILMPPP